MKEYKCQCSYVTNLEALYDSAEDGARDDGYDYDFSEDFTCEGCGSEFLINLYASVEVTVSIMDITCTHETEVSIHGVPVMDLIVGDEVSIEDGRYEICNKIYIVEDNKVQAIFNSTTDENQMALTI